MIAVVEAVDQHRVKGTCWVGTLRGRRRGRRQVRIGASDPSLTPVAGMLAVTELVDRLEVVPRLDEAIGPIKQRARGRTGGEFLVGLACAQLAGEDYLVGLDRRRADAAGEVLSPVPTAPSTTAATLAKRFNTARWRAVETAVGQVSATTIGHLSAARRQALLAAPTLDLDAADVEVYGRRKGGVAYNYKGQRAGRPHLASWAELGGGAGRGPARRGRGPPRRRGGPAAPVPGRPRGGHPGPRRSWPGPGPGRHRLLHQGAGRGDPRRGRRLRQLQVRHGRAVTVLPPRLPQVHAYTEPRREQQRRATRPQSCADTISGSRDPSKPLTSTNIISGARKCLRIAEVRPESAREHALSSDHDRAECPFGGRDDARVSRQPRSRRGHLSVGDPRGLRGPRGRPVQCLRRGRHGRDA